MRISGFASGLDIDAMVKTLMKSHQAPVTKLQKQSVKIEWQQEAYRSVSTSLVDLRNNKLSTYTLSSSINAKKAEVTGNSTAVSATTQGNTLAGVYNVTVTDLATAAKATAISSIKDGGFVPSTDPDIDVNANKPPSQRPLSMVTGYTGNSSIVINNVTIEFDADTDTFQDLIIKINNNKEANVTAIYNSNTGALSITSKTTGGVAITADDTFKSLFNNTGDPVTSTWDSKAGDKAKAYVNDVLIESDTNQITINGLNIQLKTIHSDNAVSTITVSTDTDKIMNTIKSFINDYNSVLESLNGKISEDRFRNYDPLIDEEKEAMTDKQIELWESKAKSGLLKNDTIISALVSNMRAATMSYVGNPDDKFNIQSVGISTGKWYEGGKLVIEDEDRLRAAIEADPDKVISLFTANTADTTTKTNKATNPEVGIFNRLSSLIMDSLSTLSEKAGTSRTSTSTTGSFLEASLLGREKKNIADKITDYNARLARLEIQYYKQFTAMETAINRYNSQAGSIANYAAF